MTQRSWGSGLPAGPATLVCDLDGVVFLGQTAVPGAGDALRRMEEAGWDLRFATNNSAGRPTDIQAKLSRVAGFQAEERQIITSAMVAGSLVEKGPVLVMAEVGVEAAVIDNGFELTEAPTEAKTVVAGIDRGITYDRIDRAAAAVRGGARLIVTNRDPTFPTDTGLRPGAGACAAAVETAAGVTGVVAGKPSRAMREFIEAGCGPGPIWMVGDRPDTDLALADGDRWHTVLVLSGVTSRAEGVEPVPDLVAVDLPAAVVVLLGR